MAELIVITGLLFRGCLVLLAVALGIWGLNRLIDWMMGNG